MCNLMYFFCLNNRAAVWLVVWLGFFVQPLAAQQFLLGEWLLEPFQRGDSVYVFSQNSWYFTKVDQQLYAGRMGDMGAVDFVKINKTAFRLGKDLSFDYNPSTQLLTHLQTKLRYYKKDMQVNFREILAKYQYVNIADSAQYFRLTPQGTLESNLPNLDAYKFVMLERHTFSEEPVDLLHFYYSEEDALQQSETSHCYAQLILVYLRDKIRLYSAICIEESFCVPVLRRGDLLAELKAIPHDEKVQN